MGEAGAFLKLRRHQTAVDIAYRRLQLLTGSRYGISWITNYSPTDDERLGTGTNMLLPESVQMRSVVLGPGEHPFPTAYAVQRPEIRIEPSIYLEALLKDFRQFRGRIVVRRADTADTGAGVTLAGSSSTMADCLRHLATLGDWSEDDLVQVGRRNPARVLGVRL